MRFKELASAIGGIFLYILIFCAIVFLIALFFGTVAKISAIVIPILAVLSTIIVILSIVILLPLCFFKKTRGISGLLFYLLSYVHGAYLWTWGLLLTLALWGWFWVIFGLLFFGVGPPFLAVFATLFKGLWTQFFGLIYLFFITFGSRFLGMYLLDRYETERELVIENSDEQRIIIADRVDEP